MSNTLDRIMSPHGVAIPDHLVAQAEVELISDRPQRQGDVYVIPQCPGRIDGATPIPPEGIAVVRGEAGGNTHLLVGEGPVSWLPKTVAGDAAIQGVLDVREGGSAYLLHPEHGAQGIGPGQYIVRRQREQQDKIALVRD
jgi:hypothetical protein